MLSLYFDHVFKNSEYIFCYCTIQNQRFCAMYAKKNPPSKYLKNLSIKYTHCVLGYRAMC